MSVKEFTEDELVRGMIRPPISRPTFDFDHIVNEIVLKTGITREAIFARDRRRHVMVARLMLYRELRAYNLSYPTIGRLLGRDHSTILTAVKAAEAREKLAP
jgi:chromosomal replication initiation ATPase DnaA